LLGAFGSEGLLPASMHYRWSYRAQQEDFLRAEFGRVAHSGPDRTQRRLAGEQLMNYFNGFLPMLGITPESAPTVEATYLDLLDALDAHFQHHPYLIGRPSIADFVHGLFAHGPRPRPGNADETWRRTRSLDRADDYAGHYRWRVPIVRRRTCQTMIPPTEPCCS
jgi:glutathione S-transferase